MPIVWCVSQTGSEGHGHPLFILASLKFLLVFTYDVNEYPNIRIPNSIRIVNSVFEYSFFCTFTSVVL